MLSKKRVRSDIPDFVPFSRPRIHYNPLKHSLASLPYHVLVTILTYAGSTPETIHGWPNTSFLLSCATLCRTLHDPAITALYNNPPSLPSTKAHRLLQALRARPQLGQKIKRIVIEIDPLLTTKLGGVSWDVCEFVLLAKGLRDLQFAHRIDNPPYHEGPGMKLGWRYPDALWNALEGKGPPGDDESKSPRGEGVRLKSWKWNGMFVGKLSYADISKLNKTRSFSGLTSLSLIYFDTLDDNDGTGEGKVENDVVELLALLSELRDIKFECSSLVNKKFISLFVTYAAHLRLRELRFINCPLLDSEEYTECEGSEYTLKTLLEQPICRTLNVLEVLQCRACPLNFTAGLWATPELEYFAFDGHLFNTSSYSRSANADPDYHSLLSCDHVPVWPKTLRSITATSLRKWTSGECVAFLTSLVNSAPDMSRLRKLEIWSMLTDIDWRERAGFRENWFNVMKDAFNQAEKVDVRFDNARPAEQLYKAEDFVDKMIISKSRPKARPRGGKPRGRGAVRGAINNSSRSERETRGLCTKNISSIRGGGAARGAARGGRGRGTNTTRRRVVIIRESESEGDEEYIED